MSKPSDKPDPTAELAKLRGEMAQYDSICVRLASALEREQAKTEQLRAERDDWKRDFETELEGAKRLRRKHGARATETFPEFVGRLAADLQQAEAENARLRKIAVAATAALAAAEDCYQTLVAAGIVPPEEPT